MAAKDFQELIKSQMETTRALLSAEEAANYDTIIAERQLQFDKNNEKARKAADTRKDNAAKKAQEKVDELPKKNAEFVGPVFKTNNEKLEERLEENREAQKEIVAKLGGSAKQDARWQELDTQIKTDEAAQLRAGKEGASLLQAEVKIMGDNLGEFASDSKEYQKKSYEAQIAVLNERLANPELSKSAKREIEDEKLKLQEKQGGMLGLIASGIMGLRKDFNIADKIKSAGKGIMTLLKTSLVAGFALAMLAFLNSKYWEDTKTYIVDVLLPKLKEFYNAFFGEDGGFMKGISELFGDESGIGSIVLAIGSVVTFLVGMKIFQIATAMVNGFKAIKAGFITMKAAMLATKASLATTLAPLLPIIAIAAAIGVVVFALKTAFDDFQKTLEETGSIGEALKVGGAKFIGFILGFIPSMITKLVGFVAGLFGFESLKEKLNAMNPIQFIADAVKKVFDGIGNFFSGIPEKVGAALGNMADMAKDFLKTVLRSVLPKPGGSMFSISGIASKAIPKGVYEFAGMNPETGELIAPAVTNAVAPNPAMAGNVAGRPNFQSLMDTRARQMTEAKLDKATGGSTVVVDAKSTNVVNSNSTSSATFTNTSTRNPNPAVASLNLSY